MKLETPMNLMLIFCSRYCRGKALGPITELQQEKLRKGDRKWGRLSRKGDKIKFVDVEFER